MKQPFVYYMHDESDSDERRRWMESQGVRLTEEAWAKMGRPFDEVALRAYVEDDGKVTIEGVHKI